MKLNGLGKTMILFKRKQRRFVTLRDIYLDDVRAVFFPRTFHEKYRYLGNIPWKEDGVYFDAILPLILLMEYEAKPWWCPRWFLRYLFLFGSDNSMVRVRNSRLHNLLAKLTKGTFMFDWKTKWEWYDLRISVAGSERVMNLADDIERCFYDRYSKEKD